MGRKGLYDRRRGGGQLGLNPYKKGQAKKGAWFKCSTSKKESKRGGGQNKFYLGYPVSNSGGTKALKTSIFPFCSLTPVMSAIIARRYPFQRSGLSLQLLPFQ